MYTLSHTLSPGKPDPRLPGAYPYHRQAGNEIEFVPTMLFESMDTVRAFAGEDCATPVTPPAAWRLLALFDAESAHYLVRTREAQ